MTIKTRVQAWAKTLAEAVSAKYETEKPTLTNEKRQVKKDWKPAKKTKPKRRPRNKPWAKRCGHKRMNRPIHLPFATGVV